MWLKIIYDEDDLADSRFQPQNISVSLDRTITVPIPNHSKTFRCSPIFPLNIENEISDISNTNIMFFSLPNAYSALGRLEKMGNQLVDSIFFSLGLASVILIYNDENLLTEFHSIVKQVPIATEHWIIVDGRITNIIPLVDHINITHKYNDIDIDYSQLDITERAIIDEFRVSIKLLLLKLAFHMPSEGEKFNYLVEEVQKHAASLVYLKTHDGAIPKNLSEYSAEDLLDKKLESTLRHQKIDRIVQINSSLSYISTQAFSGAIPILERRSLVRRSSLLGIGSAILALNRIARFIETAFASIAFEDIINESMKIAPSLKDLDNFPKYSRKQWHKSSIEALNNKRTTNRSYFKLPYFSGRLGYRETEYSIAAAIQSVTSGASLEWSLMTITHEMLHGHVRNILTTIFFNEETDKVENLQKNNYKHFAEWADNRTIDITLLQSIRNVIFGYCCLTATHGSMSRRAPENSENDFRLLSEEQVWKIFGDEQRNINEIFVHVLDLHYFYASKTAVYIPLIWCTWLAVPHVIGQLRHYILRSLLSISSTILLPTVDRFWSSVERFKEVLQKHRTGKLNYPTIDEILHTLNDKEKLLSEYFYSFSASLCLVDLAKDIFYSSSVRDVLLNDFRVQWTSDEKNEIALEGRFSYDIDPGFNDECIEAPLAYLLDRMIRELESVDIQSDLERETTIQFLALNSIK